MSLRQLMDLSGKVAVITGGSRGLGLQMTEALGELGAKVAITARKQHELDAAAEQLSAQGIDVLTCSADLSRYETIPTVVDRVIEKFGRIDILVNNAGTTWGAPAEDHPADAWHKVLNLNVNALFFLTQLVAKRCMIPNRWGKVINVASVAGLMGNPPGMDTIAYNTSKGAVVNFTRALAAEWGKYNINVNAICPGVFPTKIAKVLVDTMSDMILATTPLGRMGGPEDLKGLVALFASEAGRHITGQWVAVDGGASVI
ncbi:SDR family oxidoreductase [Desulfatitalea tepidiphila]|uniref:SDR family oxidoreductase n=1 Tax=Desulfatitalea tepidiphila TaxID=1185843 RepID=UPI0006B5EC1F|nr:SDR family oxidoreductase [Desulfatitalea tepidiphila]